MGQLNFHTANDVIAKDTAVFWFRRDLRLEDNAGLYHALRENEKVVPIFIFDTEILYQLEDTQDRRVHFIHRSLKEINDQLASLGSGIVIFYGTPEEVFSGIEPLKVYTNHDYEPYARERDAKVKRILSEKGITFHTFKDQVIFERNEIVKDNGEPYTVFSPYSRKWKSMLKSWSYKEFDTKKFFHHFKKFKSPAFPQLEDIGFKETDGNFPERIVNVEQIKSYHLRRNFPGVDGTSKLSVHIRFGTVSIRKLVDVAVSNNDVWLNELIWREFYQMILWHFPFVTDHPYNPSFNFILWRNDPADFERWCEGTTGYPMVDAGMRELNATGYMHNRVRMITASFLVKHLLIDYRWGESYFAKKLIDYDLASNNGGWQWAAGCGLDAAPYFRVFNPALQHEKFDKDSVYVKRWVPEFGTLEYPQPMVEHFQARDRFLKLAESAMQELNLKTAK